MGLMSACPSLERLRLLNSYGTISSPGMEAILKMLSERRIAVKGGWAFYGIPVRAIKELTLDLEGMEAATLEELKKVVSEVLDSGEFPRFIVVEVEI